VLANVPLGFQFRTFVNLRGTDRTTQLEFSVENSNLEAPFYSIDHFDEINAVYAKGQGRGESRATALVEDAVRIGASRWNRHEAMREASYEVEDAALEEVARAELADGKPREELYATFLNTPGSQDAPRSLYGIDWDLGDLVRVTYARKQFTAEILIVYVSINENGVEEITGRNQVGAIG
jgi:ReqiPepy6 Gp37-like protein